MDDQEILAFLRACLGIRLKQMTSDLSSGLSSEILMKEEALAKGEAWDGWVTESETWEALCGAWVGDE